MKKQGNFSRYYDDCETEVLKLLHNYNMNFAQLSRETGISYSVLTNLAYGITSPIYLSGKRKGIVKDIAQKICDYFFLDVADVFPRYLCNLQARAFSEASEILPYETYSEKVADENIFENRHECKLILKKVKNFTSRRNYEIFVKYTMYNASFEDLAYEYKISRNRCVQIFSKIIKILRTDTAHIARQRFKIQEEQKRKATRRKYEQELRKKLIEKQEQREKLIKKQEEAKIKEVANKKKRSFNTPKKVIPLPLETIQNNEVILSAKEENPKGLFHKIWSMIF